jgi:S-DNA-T family DNA segregation ATPase FtsK/SpoIIIE
MTDQHRDDDQDAEVVPLRPERPGSEVAVPAGAEAHPAVPEPGGAGAAPAGEGGGPPRVIYADITSGDGGERRPIIPLQLRRENLRGTVAVFAAVQWHRSRYHGLRFPLYVLAHLIWALAGVLRLAAQQVRWAWVLEQHGLRSEAAAAGDAVRWMQLHKEAKATRKTRLIVLGAELAALGIAALVLVRIGPWWAWPLAVLAAVPLLARAGRPEGYRIVSPAIIPPDYSPPTHEIIQKSLGSLGIDEINKALRPDRDGKFAGIRFITDVMRDGPGWSCHLDLPHGVTASHILAKREELASGLRRPLSATWPAGVPEEHPGRLELWVGFHDISRAKPAACPLVKTRSTDLFDTIPFGTDPRGRGVAVPMFEVNWLIGASPGQGKTAAVRVLACGTALDPLADLWIHELAGQGDLDPLGKVCHRYTSGLDEESIAYSAESARMLRAETARRATVFKKLKGTGALPDGKVTRELAARYKELRPLVAFFDEVQNLLTDGEHGKQAAEDLAYAIRVGRAYGIIVVLSTQRPDAKIIPTAISGLIVSRFCLMVPGQPENDLVLGTGAYKAGYRSTNFRPKLDAGLGWLKGGEAGIPGITRTYYLDLPATDRIATRARAMREAAGVLTGYALGLDDEAGPARDVLADVLAVIGTGNGMHWAPLADQLAEKFPERWADATAEAVSAQCRAAGVASVDVKVDGTTLKGARRVLVERALKQRGSEAGQS